MSFSEWDPIGTAVRVICAFVILFLSVVAAVGFIALLIGLWVRAHNLN